jgi:hypothetical protein
MYDPVMPINVVWEKLTLPDPGNLRAAAANEVGRKRKPPGEVADVAPRVRPAAPKSVLASLPPDAYDPLFVDLAIRRWRAFTGEKAIRESDGARFDALDPATRSEEPVP